VSSPVPRRSSLRRWRALAGQWGPFAALTLVALVAWRAGLPHALSPAALGHSQDALRAAVGARPLLTLLLYVAAYAVLTAACLPVALVLSLMGGLIFGAWLGAAAVLAGATGGAMLTYAATRSAFAPALVARAERDPRLQRIIAGFGRGAFSYVLTLRLLPFFPFALVNIAAGLAAVPVRAYALATLAGGLPTAFIYASLGAGLGVSLGSDRSLAQALRAPEVIGPLAGLTLLSLAPMLWRRLRRRAGP